jgi:hypothetical protein
VSAASIVAAKAAQQREIAEVHRELDAEADEAPRRFRHYAGR